MGFPPVPYDAMHLANLVPVFVAAMAAWLLAAAASPLHAANLDVDTSLALAHDSNLGRAAPGEDRRADTLAQAKVSAATQFALGDVDNLTLVASARGDAYSRFTGLDAVEAGIDAVYRRKLGLGLLAPWISGTLSAARYDSRSAIRDGDIYAVELEAGKRFSETFAASAGYRYERRHARNDFPVVPGISGAVFDLAGQSGFARASYAISDKWLQEGRYEARRGDVESTSRQGLAIFLASSAIAEDFVLGPELYAYRLRGTTQTLATGLSYALGGDSSLNFTYAFEYTRTVAGLDYRTHLIGMMWLYRF